MNGESCADTSLNRINHHKNGGGFEIVVYNGRDFVTYQKGTLEYLLGKNEHGFSRASSFGIDITIEDYLAGAKVGGGEFDFFILMSQNHWT